MTRAIELKLVHLIPPRLPLDRPRTFEEATKLEAVSENSYKAQLRADWSLGPRVFGGYLIGIILRAAQEHCVRSLRASHSAPGSWNVHFLESPTIGNAIVRLDILRASFMSTFLRIEIVQDDKLCVTATVLQHDLKTSQDRGLKLPLMNMSELPFANLRRGHGVINEQSLQRDGWETVDMAKHGHQFYFDKPGIKFFFPPGTNVYNSEHIIHPKFGPDFRDQWWTFGRDSLITPASLPIILDLFSTLHASYPEGANYFTTSESIACETRRVSPGQGWEWIFCRSQIMECSGGKYVVHITVMDADGQVVALAKMVNLLMSLEKLKAQGETVRPTPKL